MDSRRCGHSGLCVSDLALGTLLWGRDTQEAEAIDMLAAFVDAGGSLVEVSTSYGGGAALEVLGRAIDEVGRDRVIIALREGLSPVHSAPTFPAASRASLLRAVDGARRILNTDTIDLLVVGPDHVTPMKESIDAAVSVHERGLVHYLGLSHRSMWDTAWACGYVNAAGRAPLTACEEDVSLLTYPQSAGFLQAARGEGLGVIAHSPLAGGVLSGKYRHSTPPDSRAASAHLHHLVEWALTGEHLGIIEAVVRAAEGLGRTPLDVALAWVRDLLGVTSVLMGPRTLRQLEQILGASSEPLPAQIRQVLTEIATREDTWRSVGVSR